MKSIKIGSRIVGNGNPIFIIAEIGLNHNGKLKLAKDLIQAAANCGVDAVKFQTYKTELFLSRNHPTFNERKKLELPFEWHGILKDMAKENGVEFISTPLDSISADFLYKLDISCFKVASCDLNNYIFIEYLAKMGKPIILSTGLSTLCEVEKAVETVLNTGNEQLILLHCVSSYPPEIQDLNLSAIRTLKSAFKVPVGFSDHTTGILPPIISTVLGACVLEKHFTLDQNLPGYDHRISVTPPMMKKIVKNVHATENALGSGIKKPKMKELSRIQSVRRSLYWKDSYQEGKKISSDMILALRPGVGMDPNILNMLIGNRLKHKVKVGQLVKLKDIDWDNV